MAATNCRKKTDQSNSSFQRTPVQPDPAALRAIVDFNTQSFGHEQI
jgi:hypothetical protein